ncbi:hypothetical protein AB4Z38_02615 [Arthrobacter sp. 2RAF6]|uniref:hypothetical protein n=1 Tax=Arthrobacter sp. 2RAF6 TaxID=3233002 RepID=UPI003F8F6941
MRRGGLAPLGNDGGCRTGSFPDTLPLEFPDLVSRGLIANDGDTVADRKLNGFTDAAGK